nr:MAG TPA: hypothetical protein [Caudoviricetes sp.]
MKNERLYVDNELVDIDELTKITLNFKSNLFRDVSRLTSNNTYTIKLPKTVRNQKILKHTDLVQSSSSFPYTMHKVRYFRNGIEVIKDGRLTVLQATEDAIEACIVWGLFSNFSDLMRAGTTLNQLKSNDRILYKDSNEVVSYEDAVKANYFYAYYDVWTHEKKVVEAWEEGDRMIYPLDGRVERRKNNFGGHRGGDEGVSNLHPVVKASFILDLIKKNTGINFSFCADAQRYIDTLIVPLINKKSNELTFDRKFKAELLPTTSTGGISLKAREESVLFDISDDNATVIEAKSEAKVIIDVKGTWEFDITGMLSEGSGTPWAPGDYYNFILYYIKVIITRKDDKDKDKDETFVLGSDRGFNLERVPSGYQGVFRYEIYGHGGVEVKEGDTIKFEWCHDRPLREAAFLGGTIEATISSKEEVPSGGYFPIANNLPKIKVIDFIKFLSVITGTFPLQIAEENKISFEPLSQVWENREEAKDWTEKVIAQSDENKPKRIDFKISDYAQHNLYKWKADNTVGSYDGDLEIDNETLDAKRVVYEFPFAATDGNNVPMYTAPKEGKEEDKPSYKACKDRILRLEKGENGKAVAVFDINMQDILREKYRHIGESLQRVKVITEKIRISDIELLDYDETKPIYLAQYGNYYAITEIKADEAGFAEVTMFQLY